MVLDSVKLDQLLELPPKRKEERRDETEAELENDWGERKKNKKRIKKNCSNLPKKVPSLCPRRRSRSLLIGQVIGKRITMRKMVM